MGIFFSHDFNNIKKTITILTICNLHIKTTIRQKVKKVKIELKVVQKKRNMTKIKERKESVRIKM